MFINKLIYFLSQFLCASYRFRYEGLENLIKLKDQNYILAIWHQNLLPGILAQAKRPYVVIVSRSKDAEPVAYTCKRLGHQVVRGSSRNLNGIDKGGYEAQEEMIKVLKSGIPGAVTVDGPKGPARKCKPGIFHMASRSNSVIIPYTVKARWYLEFKSWDSFQLPLPFSSILVHYAVPFYPDIKNIHDSSERLNKQLNMLSESTQQRVRK